MFRYQGDKCLYESLLCDHVGVGVDVLEADHLRRHELRGADHGPDQSEATIVVT